MFLSAAIVNFRANDSIKVSATSVTIFFLPAPYQNTINAGFTRARVRAPTAFVNVTGLKGLPGVSSSPSDRAVVSDPSILLKGTLLA